MQRVAFVSDAHLGGSDSEHERKKEKRLLSFFEYAQSEFTSICIVGDLFDFWFEYKHAVINRYYAILFKFSELVKNGVKLHYIAGNHDFWMRDFLEKEVGITVHRHAYETNINELRVFIKHGDGIHKSDVGYRLLKKVLQNRMAIQCYRFIHPDIGVPMAHFFSNASRDKTSNKTFEGGDDYRHYAQQKINNGFDVVVLAHTHQPEMEKLNGGVYLNPGDWIRHFSYGTIDGDGVRLLYWREGEDI